MSEAISGVFLPAQNPACRYAHAGYCRSAIALTRYLPQAQF
jgi:hypothetical protein